jgi:phage terminase large subunit-like protein
VYLRRAHFADLPPLVLDVHDGVETQKQEFTDYPAIAKRYAEACVAGTNPVCRYVVLAAERYLRMLKMAETESCLFYFSPAHVVDYCAFIEKLRHFESGSWEYTQRSDDGTVNQFIILEPFQIWIESAIQGFRRRLTGERLVTKALEILPRKNAKSLRAVPAALFDLCCSGQLAPEIPIAASTSRQADDTLYGDLVKMVNNEPELVERYRLKVTTDEIRCGEGRIFKLSSQGERQDGLNPSLAIFEEGHAGAATVYRVVNSAFGARPNALLRMITTAGYRPEGPGYELRLEAIMVLEGKSEDFTFFAAIYELDDDDYRHKETKAIEYDKIFGSHFDRLMAKCNPMYRVSLDPIKMNADKETARRRPDLRSEFVRTRFNVWTGQGKALIDLASWMACKRPIQIEDFFGAKCWIGVDLAQVLDMCAIVLLFMLPNDTMAMFAKFFLPAESPTAQDPDLSDQLRIWAEEGWLTLTPGPLADHEMVRDEVDAFCDVFDVQVIACDPHQAHNTVKYLWDGQRPVMTYSNNAATMTPPTDDILGRIAAQTIWHDGNPVMAWMAANVHGDRRGNGLILPRKESENSKRKIDGFVATCFANGVRMEPNHAKTPDGDEKKTIDPFVLRGKLLGYEEAKPNG